MKRISGNIVDVLNSRICSGTLVISEGRIADIIREETGDDTYIIPGFVDAHIHIESSMLTPAEFSRIATVHGTVATISDPHEIANVLGTEGVKYMIEDAKMAPLKFCFGAPSCVPATPFETAGAVLGVKEVEELLKLDEIGYLGEVMNFPGVLNGDTEVMEKIRTAAEYSKPVDGHAPGLRGAELERYMNAGISTNHECLSCDEVVENIEKGVKVQIRKGSAADIFEECLPILDEHYESCMFCSDDKHPDDLLKGHINDMVKGAIDYGVDVMKVLRIASVNPALHYRLDVGLLRRGDPADFIRVDNLTDLNILETHIDGRIVAREGASLIPEGATKIINNFHVAPKEPDSFEIPYVEGRIYIIKATDDTLFTDKLIDIPKVENGCAVSDTKRDILKLAVVNRYKSTKPAVGFVNNFGIQTGAIASSVAHDSHNIVAVGVSDEDICRAVNLIISNRGGIGAVLGNREMILPLPIAGIMSDKDYASVADGYTRLDKMAKAMGSRLRAPFMTLSFMALLVIPRIKMSDKGLFDAEAFGAIDLFCR
ncbi:MAG: adenine deaminase [Deltaproteobacteria bacterium]|nr:adenine deaminase [Deltaproteobacteria bacterium]